MLSHFYKKSQSLNLSMSAFKGKKFFFKIVKFKKKKKKLEIFINKFI
jgi:hypothetical protein